MLAIYNSKLMRIITNGTVKKGNLDLNLRSEVAIARKLFINLLLEAKVLILLTLKQKIRPLDSENKNYVIFNLIRDLTLQQEIKHKLIIIYLQDNKIKRR